MTKDDDEVNNTSGRALNNLSEQRVIKFVTQRRKHSRKTSKTIFKQKATMRRRDEEIFYGFLKI